MSPDPRPNAREGDAPPSDAVPTTGRGRIAFGLTGLAVVQPLLSLFGQNPEFFVARDATGTQIVVFGAALALGVPLASVAVVALGRLGGGRVAQAVFSVVVGLLAGVGLAVMLNQAGAAAGVLPLGAAFGLCVAVGERRFEGLHNALRYLWPAPVAFLALFLVASQTSALIWDSGSAAAPAESVGAPADITMLVFDELPIASLMDADGNINEERFPNFARLADEGMWFRNASSSYARTEASVPSLLSSDLGPRGQIPSTIDFPRNLFSMLGGHYEMNVAEEVTALCPDYACDTTTASASAGLVDGTVSSLTDAAVVFGHSALPESWRTSLPEISRSWGGFLEGDEADVRLDPFAARRDDPLGTQTQLAKAAIFTDAIDAIEPGDRPTLDFAHAVFPHSPWVLTPEGDRYGSTTDGLIEPELQWENDPWLVRQGQAQHLLQVGYADQIVGQMIERLEAQGRWEDSMIIVTADHGAAFAPGEMMRAPTDTNLDEIFRVPLFMKLPGQTEGETRDEPAQLVDVLPTVVEALDVDVDWEFDGRSLLSDDAARERTLVLDDAEAWSSPLDDLLAVAARNAERFPVRDWTGVAAVGEHGSLVGTSVSDAGAVRPGDASWSIDQADAFTDIDPDDAFVPALITGQLDDVADPPAELVVAANGTVVGVAGGLQPVDGTDGSWSFSGLLAHELLDPGANDLALYLPTGSTGDIELEEAQPVASTRYELAADGAILDDDGRPLTLLDTEETAGFTITDDFSDGSALTLRGWAVGPDGETEPDEIVLLVDGEQIPAGRYDLPDIDNPTPELSSWGFDLLVATNRLPADADSGVAVAVFGDQVLTAPVSLGR